MISDAIYKDYITKLLAGNRAECMSIINNLLTENVPLKDLYEQLFQKSLYEVGTLWENNKISVANEHLCTSITEGLISLTHPLIFAAAHSGKKVVVTCTPGENHQVGARMVADYFEFNGWNSYFLGPNTPYIVLEDFLQENQPDLLVVTMSVLFNLISLRKLVTRITKKFPELKIIVGGQGFSWGCEDAFDSLPMIEIIRTLDELDVKILNSHQDELMHK